jgi:hypothetical protein
LTVAYVASSSFVLGGHGRLEMGAAVPAMPAEELASLLKQGRIMRSARPPLRTRKAKSKGSAPPTEKKSVGGRPGAFAGER